MSPKAFEKNLDMLVEDAADRAKAIKQLRDIAIRYPDLVRRTAEMLDQDNSPTATSHQPLRGKRNRPLRPTAAVRHWLRKHPDGGTSADIASGVLGSIGTSSNNPRAVVYSTIAVLKRRGEIEVEDRGDEPAIYRLAEPEE